MSSVTNIFSKLINRLSPQRSAHVRQNREESRSSASSDTTSSTTWDHSTSDWGYTDFESETDSGVIPRSVHPSSSFLFGHSQTVQGAMSAANNNGYGGSQVTSDGSSVDIRNRNASECKPSTSKEVQVDSTCNGTVKGVEENDNGLECAVCLLPCIHPVQLPCNHIFCYLCVKGVANQSRRCALCRQDIPRDFLNHPALLRLEDLQRDCQFEDGSTWFYEGKNGWWQYDERTSHELEERHKRGIVQFELLIAGFIYVINLNHMVQARRNDPTRRRKIKRDVPSNIPDKKGVAGLKVLNVQATPERRQGDGGEVTQGAAPSFLGATAVSAQAAPSPPQSSPSSQHGGDSDGKDSKDKTPIAGDEDDDEDDDEQPVPSNSPQSEGSPAEDNNNAGDDERDEDDDELNARMSSLRMGGRRVRRHQRSRRAHLAVQNPYSPDHLRLFDSPPTTSSDSDYDY